MPTRRAFLQSAVLAASVLSARATRTYATGRPPLADRKFTSDAVEAKIQAAKKRISDPELAWMFENCFPNTLDTTVRIGELDGKPDTFVITGDINAMWLRDSAAQVWPYLPLAKDDAKLKNMLAGVVNRHARCVRIDPYANAFNFGATGSEWSGDHTPMKPELHERKWEIDSLCYTVRLAHGYWKATGDSSCFDAAWRQSAALIVKTFREQQRLYDRGPYYFQRTAANPSDSLPQGGYGNPTRPCGMIHSAFRPSDDACIFPFLIPSNLFAVTSLAQLAEIHTSALSDRSFAAGCHELADEVRQGIAKWATGRQGRHGEIYAFEADGYGNQLFIDDGNAPSLLSLPYLGCCVIDDPLYQRTRAFVLSDDNPYFYRGTAGEGLGGPHSGLDMIWPLGIITRALTTRDEKETAACLRILKATHAGTGFMHESFFRNNPDRFTRKWFAWANTLFGELILQVLDAHPSLLVQ